MSEIMEIIAKKRKLLALAQAEVKAVETQIRALEDAMADDTDFAQYLEEKKAKSTAVATPTIAPSKQVSRDYYEKPKKMSATASGRNPKGLIRRELLAMLKDGHERDLDFIERVMNQRTPTPVARSALRAFLMKLRGENVVTSRKPGLFQLVQKGESPASTGLSGATESDGS